MIRPLLLLQLLHLAEIGCNKVSQMVMMGPGFKAAIIGNGIYIGLFITSSRNNIDGADLLAALKMWRIRLSASPYTK